MRTRILLIIGTALAVMLAVILIASRTILLRPYDAMERATMGVNIERVQNALEQDLLSMGQTATDWAAWDDTYQFIQTLSADYIRENLTDRALANLDIDLMAFYAPGRGLVHWKAAGNPPPDLETLVTRYPDLASLPGSTAPVAGIALLAGTPWLVVSRPVLDSDGLLAPRGRLILGREISAERVSQLSRRVRVGLELLPEVRPEPDGGETPAVERPAVDRLRAYTLLQDMEGIPLATIAVDAWSDIRGQALNSTYALVASIIATGLLFGAGTLIYLERRVLARLHSLGSQVLAIKTGEMSSRRLEVGGTDQIAYLAAAINGMLAALETSTENLRQSERRTLAFLDAVPDLIFLLDADGTIRDLRVPEGETDPAELRGRSVATLQDELPWLSPDTFRRLEAQIRVSRETNTPGRLETEITVDGRSRWYEIRISGSLSGETVVVARDVTAQRSAEVAEQKDLLLRETHHRVRNNLQVISSLLALQANAAQDPDTRAMLEESQDRVRSMALIHERLSHNERSGGQGFASYLRDLVEQLGNSYGEEGRVRIETALQDVALPEDASLPAGLVVNELLTNALRHAFPGGRAGQVFVRLSRSDSGCITITVEDDGIGLPDWVDIEQPVTLGCRIIRALVDQLGAKLEVERSPGTIFRLLLAGPMPSA